MDADTTVCKAVFGLAEGCSSDFSKSRMLYSRFVRLKSSTADHEATRTWSRGLLWLRCDKEAGRRKAQVCLTMLAIDAATGELVPESKAPLFGSSLGARDLCDHMDRAGYDVDDEENPAMLYNLARACARTLTTQQSFAFSVDEKAHQLHLGLKYADGGATNLVFDVLSRRVDGFIVKFMLDVAFALMPEARRQEIHQRFVLEQAQEPSWSSILLKEHAPSNGRKRLAPAAARERRAKLSQEFSTQALELTAAGAATLSTTQTPVPEDDPTSLEDATGASAAASNEPKATETDTLGDFVRLKKRRRVKTGRKRRSRGFVDNSSDEDNSD
ncbi:Hypothetical Protein FCC1311_084282 [Hondaea fermentalgiana]|uniref:Uncharacterized protein n=1 Tax=Hondaea fermentalgiana TaxID=2315210 RepID=A0A2R5GU75_9STRA|nr:Hypothetical Protein FCC1311_084282 [Hondaea fermentalgiana]|eukprot:GBG32203.1 Hypothetical Protein FCC1311_084282 [Hondaea fermentalgiana]